MRLTLPGLQPNPHDVPSIFAVFVRSLIVSTGTSSGGSSLASIPDDEMQLRVILNL